MKTTRPRSGPAALLACLCLAMTSGIGGCSTDPTAIRIKLVTDPNINTEDQVLAVVDRIELALDIAGGFAAAGDDLSLEDLDGDGESEALFSDAIAGDQTGFPLYRLRPGKGGQRQLTIRARGMVGGQLAALGDPVSAVFEDDADLEVSVPLNLRAKYLPPRVVTTLPQDGQQTVPPALGLIHVVFSKWVAPDSLPGNLQLIYQGDGTGAPLPVEGKWDLINTNVSERSLPEERTLATLVLGDCALEPGTYRIDASAAITDIGGTPLDQYAPSPTRDAFAASFTLPGTPAQQPCGTPAGCQENSDCDSSEEPKFVCAKDGGVGRCMPTPPSCGDVITCPSGYRCVDGEGSVSCVQIKEIDVCTEDVDCDPSDKPEYVCAKEGPLQGQCIPASPAPPTCATDNPCPDGWRCEGGGDGPIFCIEEKPAGCVENPELCGDYEYCQESTGKCLPCEVYPSAGCEIECTKETAELVCPEGTYCDLEKFVCRDL